MPQRTNEFQQLILQIERQLSPSATITESLLVLDSTGDQREIDVAIETQSGAHSITIAVESRDHSRPADITWIDQLHGKYRDLKVNKVVAVSRNGFTDAAYRKGIALGYSLLSLEEATASDWAADVRVLGSVTIDTDYREIVQVAISLASKVPIHMKSLNASMVAFDCPGISRPLLLAELLSHGLRNSEPSTRTEVAQGNSRNEVFVTLNLANWVVIDKYQVRRPLKSMSVTLCQVHVSTNIPLTQIDYGIAAVAHGSGRVGNIDVQVVCAATEESGKRPPINLLISPIEPPKNRAGTKRRR